jgi:hypothetical protein
MPSSPWRHLVVIPASPVARMAVVQACPGIKPDLASIGPVKYVLKRVDYEDSVE